MVKKMLPDFIVEEIIRYIPAELRSNFLYVDKFWYRCLVPYKEIKVTPLGFCNKDPESMVKFMLSYYTLDSFNMIRKSRPDMEYSLVKNDAASCSGPSKKSTEKYIYAGTYDSYQSLDKLFVFKELKVLHFDFKLIQANLQHFYLSKSNLSTLRSMCILGLDWTRKSFDTLAKFPQIHSLPNLPGLRKFGFSLMETGPSKLTPSTCPRLQELYMNVLYHRIKLGDIVQGHFLRITKLSLINVEFKYDHLANFPNLLHLYIKKTALYTKPKLPEGILPDLAELILDFGGAIVDIPINRKYESVKRLAIVFRFQNNLQLIPWVQASFPNLAELQIGTFHHQDQLDRHLSFTNSLSEFDVSYIHHVKVSPWAEVSNSLLS